LPSAKNSQGERGELFSPPTPNTKRVEPMAGVLATGRIRLKGKLSLHVVESLGARLEVGSELISNKATNKALHGEFWQIVVLSGTGHVVELYGAELAESFESTRNGAPGDAEPLLDLVKVERLRAAI
jgi:hypothetical protein